MPWSTISLGTQTASLVSPSDLPSQTFKHFFGTRECMAARVHACPRKRYASSSGPTTHVIKMCTGQSAKASATIQIGTRSLVHRHLLWKSHRYFIIMDNPIALAHVMQMRKMATPCPTLQAASSQTLKAGWHRRRLEPQQ